MKDLLIKLTYYEKELEEIRKELKTLPSGRLAKRGAYYYHVINDKGTGITRNTELIRLLCRKKYLQVREKQIKNNIAAVSRNRGKFNSATQLELIQSLPPTYQGLPIEYFFHPSIEAFLATPYPRNTYPLEDGGYFTKKGISVRTKSEFMIADQLEGYDLPYLYEAPVTLGRQRKYSDFTVKNPYNGAIIQWEHFGLLNQADYVSKMYKKMRLYMDSNYTPFETIIYTFEPDVKRPSRLQYLIETVILQT